MPDIPEAASRYRSQLSVELPQGWTVSEELTLCSPSGLRVRVRLDGVAPGTSPAQLTKRQLEQISTVVESLEELGDSTTSTAVGEETHSRDFAFRTDAGEFLATVKSTIIGDAAVVSSASWPASDPPAPADLRLLGGLSTSVDPNDGAGRVASAVSEWSGDELAYLGVISGSISGFPTVGSDPYPDTRPEVVEAVFESVVKSLAARSLIRSQNGELEPLGMYAAIAQLAFSADLVVTIESAGRGSASVTWLGVGEHGGLVVSVLDHGARRCLVMSEIEPVAAILEFSGLGQALARSAEATSGAGQPAVLATEDLLDGTSDVEQLVSVQTSWRQDDVNLGGLLTFATSTCGVWVAEADTTPANTWALTPIDETSVRKLLVQHLPSAFNSD